MIRQGGIFLHGLGALLSLLARWNCRCFHVWLGALLFSTGSPMCAADVRSFGVIGDGSADDTPALQRLLSTGGAVRLPRGTYRITRPIVVDLDRSGFTSLHGDGVARIVMAGEGPALKFLGSHDGTAAPETFKPNVWERQRMPLVDGIEIVGDHERANGIEISGVMQFTLTRTLIRLCFHAVHLTGTNRNIIIGDCHIYSNRGIGVYYDQVNLHQSNIVGTHISYCAGGGIVSLGGNVRNIQISGCDIESNQGAAGPPTANILIDCSSSRAGTAEVAITGCTIQHNSNAPDSANIRILGRGSLSPATGRQEQWGQITIGNNILSDTVTNVHLKGVCGATLTGNTFLLGYEHNLLVEDCQQIVVGANRLGRIAHHDEGVRQTARNAVVFRGSQDCTVNGLQIVRTTAAAGLLLEDCDRFNITGCTILDCDNVGLLARNLTRSRISDCIIRDDRANPAESLRIVGGSGNQIINNLLTRPFFMPMEIGAQMHRMRANSAPIGREAR